MTIRPAKLVMVLVILQASCSATSTSPHGSAHVLLSGSWPMYQLRPDHNAVIARDGLRVSWSHDAGARVNSGLAVIGNTVIFATFGKKVVALDLRTGASKWTSSVDNVAMSTPIVANALTFIGTGRNGAMNSPRAAFAYQGDIRRIWGRPVGDSIVAIDAANGHLRWQYFTAGEDMPSPAYVAGMIVFANGDRHAYGLRASTGQPVWRRDVHGISTMASATVAEGHVLIGTCGIGKGRANTINLEPRTGSVVWSSVYGDCDASPTVANGKVFVSWLLGYRTGVGFGGRDCVAALRLTDGRTLWSYCDETAGPYTRVGSSERTIAGAYADDRFFAAFPSNDRLRAFDAQTGRVAWTLVTTAPVKMSPVVYQNRIYFGDTAGLFYVADAATGNVLSIHAFDKPFTTSPPVIVGRTLLIANDDAIYALAIDWLNNPFNSPCC